MDFVDEQHLAFLEVGQHRGEITGPFDHRTRSRTNRHPKLVGDDGCERRLAETGRPVEQHVVECLAPLACRGDRNMQVLADALLPDVLVERAWPQPRLVLDVVVRAGRGEDVAVAHFINALSTARKACSKAASGAAVISFSIAFSAAARG